MLPEIDFTFSYVLQTALLRNEFNFDRLKNCKDKIEGVFSKNQTKILESIEKLSKFNWKEDYIQAWVFTGLYESVPSPVLINCTSGDEDVMLFELVRMLAYNIFIQNDKHSVKEHVPYAIAVKIVKDLIGNERINTVYKILELDTFKKPILKKALSLKL